MINCTLVLMQSTCYSYQALMKLKFSLQTLEKYSNVKFLENRSIGSRAVPCGQMDGQTDRT